MEAAMFRRKFWGLCLSFLILFVSCGEEDPVSFQDITGSDIMETEGRTVGEFHSIDFTVVGDVNLTYGMTQSVSITVDDNIIDYIATTVSNGVLTISSNPNTDLSEYDLTVDLIMTDLETLTLSGVGNIVSTNLLAADTAELILSGVGNMFLELDGMYLTSTHSGVGNFNLIGVVATHIIEHTGIGENTCFELYTDTTIAHLIGVGNAHVYAEDYLDVTIGGTGSLFYKGNPTVQQTVTGSGQVIDAN